MNQIQYGVTVFFSGIALIIGLVFVVYLLAYLADRVACMNVSTLILTPQELEERRTATDLTRRAGLAGMLSSERYRVFRCFFEKRSVAYKTEVADDDDVEAQKQTSQNETQKSNEESTNESITEEKKGVEVKDPESDEPDIGICCSICLNDYEDGDKVITGTLCTHMFHYECCMQWIEKNNEHCPYCREKMMTRHELFQAAREELGEQRVDKLKRVNEEAAARMAAFEAARRAGREPRLSDLPVPLRAGQSSNNNSAGTAEGHSAGVSPAAESREAAAEVPAADSPVESEPPAADETEVSAAANIDEVDIRSEPNMDTSSPSTKIEDTKGVEDVHGPEDTSTAVEVSDGVVEDATPSAVSDPIKGEDVQESKVVASLEPVTEDTKESEILDGADVEAPRVGAGAADGESIEASEVSSED